MAHDKSLVFVTKDIGGFRVVRPIADTLKEQGRKIIVIAEGKSLPLWQEADYSPIVIGEATSVEEAIIVLQNEGPEAVFATLGSPINLEDKFSQAANQLKIPLVWFPDVWGAETRSRAVPDVLLAFDDVERTIVATNPRFTRTHIEVVGHPLADEMSEHPSESAIRVIGELKKSGKTVILIAGQGEYTTDMIEFVQKSVMYHSIGAFVVIPRFHPKHKDEKPEWVTKWNERLAQLPEGSVVEVDKAVKTDDLARLADITVSSFSTTLIYAALAGKIPISVATPAARTAMMKSTGFDHYPPARIGATIEMISPMSLSVEGLRKYVPTLGSFRLRSFSVRSVLDAVWGEPWWTTI